MGNQAGATRNGNQNHALRSNQLAQQMMLGETSNADGSGEPFEPSRTFKVA